MFTAYSFVWPHVYSEVPEEEVTVFEGDGVTVKLQFLAELSNKMIVNAKVYASECCDASVKFEMAKVRRTASLINSRANWKGDFWD